MDHEQDLLAQADALMQRHRRFVAAPRPPREPPAPKETGEETLPVLTEVVADEPATTTLPVEALADLLRPWLARALPEALAQLGPALIEALLARLPTEFAPSTPRSSGEDPPASQQGSL